MSKVKKNHLSRELGVWDVITNVLSISIGSGIFLLPALVYVILGHGSILAYVFCGLIFLFLGLCFGELSSRVSDTGGLYVYIDRAFGPLAGFIANVLYWFGVGVLVCGALMNALADIAGTYFPVFLETWARFTFFAVITCLSCYLNIKGIKDSMVFIKVLTWTKVICLMALVAVGLTQIDPANISWEGFPEFNKVGEASILLVFAFLGCELSISVGGELKNPTRTGPIGFVVGIALVVFAFVTIHLAVQGVLGDLLLTNQEAPLAELAKELFGEFGFLSILLLSFIAVWSTLSSIFTLLPRVLFAGAQDGLMPKILAKIHHRYNTPYLAIVFLGILGFAFAASGSFQYLLILVTGASLVLYFGAILAFFKLRIIDKRSGGDVFKVKGGYLIGSITLVALGWVFSQLQAMEIQGISIFIGILVVIYYILNYFKIKNSNQLL